MRLVYKKTIVEELEEMIDNAKKPIAYIEMTRAEYNRLMELKQYEDYKNSLIYRSYPVKVLVE